MVTENKKIYTIGIDIGGTKLNAVLFDGKKVIEDYMLATPKDNLDHFLVMIKALVEPFFERVKNDKAEINGIGIGVAGVINYSETKVLFSPNLTIINNIELGKKIEEIFNLPVKMSNDADCFTRAEAIIGAAAGSNNVYGITIGTGIGGGWCRDGEIYRGHHGGAGEPGGLVIDYDNGIRLEEAYHKLTQNNPASLAEEAYRGDVLAEKIFLEVGKYLGITFANIVNLINPEVIVVGGGVVESSDLFLKEIKKYMKQYTISEDAKEVKIVKSKIGKHAGAIGAALLF